jgi:hypothetical protein
MEILEELRDLKLDNMWMKVELTRLCCQQTELINQVNDNMKYVKDLGCCVVNMAITSEDVWRPWRS